MRYKKNPWSVYVTPFFQSSTQAEAYLPLYHGDRCYFKWHCSHSELPYELNSTCTASTSYFRFVLGCFVFSFLLSLISPFSKQSVERMKITNHVFYTKPGIYEKILHSGRVMPAGKLLEKKEWTELDISQHTNEQTVWRNKFPTKPQKYRTVCVPRVIQSNSAVVTGTARKCAIKRPQFICSL